MKYTNYFSTLFLFQLLPKELIDYVHIDEGVAGNIYVPGGSKLHVQQNFILTIHQVNVKILYTLNFRQSQPSGGTDLQHLSQGK